MGLQILSNPRIPDAVVHPEDFNEVAQFFSRITKEKSWRALPGGVVDTFVPSSSEYEPTTMMPDEFRGYRVDDGGNLAEAKLTITRALEVVEERDLSTRDFTICPSVSFGTLATLMVIKQRNISTIIAEAPTYFGVVEQAFALGLQFKLWPTIPSENYEFQEQDIRTLFTQFPGPIAFLVTQPRYGVGNRRSEKTLLKIQNSLRIGDMLIIDEAADQSVPSLFSCLSKYSNVIRLRGLTKGLGLNSARVAVVFHPPALREIYGEIMDFAGGTLDATSLKLVTGLCASPARYVDLLNAASRYVREQYELLSSLLAGLPVAVSPITSGYIGTAHVFFPSGPQSYWDRRDWFLNACFEAKMPVVLGTSMYFPYTDVREIIRINYFTEKDNIVRSANVISEIITTMR